ncbi:MAG TPA: cyclic peptide export ABC transporter [Humidesulfovibrio sp.]|uniref:cyclic peptide export ABC transporter n=1 Tax=Humidesulfovibrio sp. TaxID=2910988 RepID=UPI002BA5AA11|nr:cyclic peptide export ABC transporter [Humidesulfovibrio sp.]HWR03456.1 cyclic peptide export ABC transporter [Humidesulfovibrio sp.]
MNLQNSRFITMLRQQAGPDARRIVLACLGAGLTQGLTVFSVLSGIDELSGDGVSFRTFVLFVLCIYAFYRLFHYITGKAAQLALRGVMEQRIRLAAKLRGIPMERFGRMRTERTQALLLDGQEMVVEAARMLMAAAANSVMMVVAVGRMFTTSFLGACGVLVVMVAGLCTFLWIVRSVNSLMLPARQAEMEFASDLRDLQEGFQHLKLHLGKTVDLFQRWLLPGLDRAAAARDATEQRHALGISFFAVFHLLILGLILFLMPRLLSVDAKSVTTLLVLVMFCLSPMMSLVGFVPMLGKVEMGLGELAELERQLDAEIEASESGHVEALWAGPVPAPLPFESLSLRDVRFEHRDDAGATLFSISVPEFDLNRGEIVFLCGGNGAGKTTFMRVLSGLYAPQSGSVLVNGQPLEAVGLEVYRNLFSVVPADFHLFRHVLDLRCGPERVRELLSLMRLEAKVKVQEDGSFSSSNLSAGQRKRLALVCALLEERDVCLFDEVAADFDPEFRRFFYEEMLPMLRGAGKTILAVSHDDRYFPCADRVIHMADGVFAAVAAGRQAG